MKLYRVWEADRKVYVFPENWLELPDRPTAAVWVLDSGLRRNDGLARAVSTPGF